VSPKGRYLIGFTDEKLAIDMYSKFRTLLKSIHEGSNKALDTTQSDIPSRIIEEDEMSKL
jgi:hypothetical protein